MFLLIERFKEMCMAFSLSHMKSQMEVIIANIWRKILYLYPLSSLTAKCQSKQSLQGGCLFKPPLFQDFEV